MWRGGSAVRDFRNVVTLGVSSVVILSASEISQFALAHGSCILPCGSGVLLGGFWNTDDAL